MAPKSRGRITIPTIRPLPDNLRLPSNTPHVWRTLSKLARHSLLSLAAQWCEKDNLKTCGPFILGPDEEDDVEAPYAAAVSLAEVEGLYSEELPSRKGSKREVVDRILEGDWRNGITMKQLAMAETRYVLEHQSANRWTALRLVPIGNDKTDGLDTKPYLPRIHAATFLHNLQWEIAPLAKAHFYLHQAEMLPVMILRIYLHDSPYNTTSALRTVSTNGKWKRVSVSDAPKSIFVLFPTGSPYMYVSLSSSGANLTDPESKSIQRFVIEAIPKALSQQGQRYELHPAAFTARSLSALLAHRSAERSNAAAGGWSIFVIDSKGRNALEFGERKVASIDDEDDAEKDKENASALSSGRKRPFEHADPTRNADAETHKRLKLLAASRFGEYGKPEDGKNLHSFSVRMTDLFELRSKPRARAGDAMLVDDGEEVERESFKPDVKLTFQGSHVFAGLRMLVEKGVVDGKRIPGWMTGEASVSVGVVRNGRIDTTGL